MLPRKDIEIMVRYAPGTPECIIADGGRLRQIVLNLVGNAVKFTHEGHVLINVQGTGNGVHAELKIEVVDTGIGIAPDRVEAIFEDFKQADANTTARYGGTGLGLAITRRLIDAMNGRLDVQSRYNYGSIFSVSLTCPLHGNGKRDDQADRSISGSRVLIVDDMHMNRQIYAEQLRSWRVDCDTAKNGRAAYEKILSASRANQPYDLILLDKHMPALDGEQVASAIRATPDINNTRILMLASASNDGNPAHSDKLAICTYLTKPVRPTSLFNAIADALSGDAPLLDKETLMAVQNAKIAPSPLPPTTNQATGKIGATHTDC